MDTLNNPKPEPSFVTVGVDFGKMQDYTAIVIAERRKRDDDRIHHTVRMIERLPLVTSYPDIGNRVAEVMNNLELLRADHPQRRPARLIVDATGVGVAATDVLRERGLKPVAVTITGSDRATQREDGTISVGKAYLISRLQVLLQNERLHLPDTDEADLLVNELKDYELKYTDAGNVTFSARSGKHDDLVLALAMATAVDVPRPKHRKPPAGALNVSGKVQIAKASDEHKFAGKGIHYKRVVHNGNE